MEEGLIRRLMSSIKCSACGQHYNSYDIDVLGHNDDIWFLRIRCDACQTQSLLAAIIKDTSARLASQLTGRKSEAVSASDLLEMHEFLDTFDGDFKALFEKG